MSTIPQRKRITQDEVTDYIYQKVFEEFGLATGIFLDHKEIFEYKNTIGLQHFDLTRIPRLPIQYVSSQGGLHLDDVAIYALFFSMKGAQIGVDWSFGMEDDEYHWFVEFDDASSKVTAVQELVGQYFRFEGLANYLALQTLTPLRIENIKSISLNDLDEKLRDNTEEYWIKIKEMEKAGMQQMEAALERMFRGMSAEEKRHFTEAASDTEAEKRLRQYLDDAKKKFGPKES